MRIFFCGLKKSGEHTELIQKNYNLRQLFCAWYVNYKLSVILFYLLFEEFSPKSLNLIYN